MMKIYMKPDAEIVEFAALETVADSGANPETGVTSNPFDIKGIAEDDRRD